MPSAAIQDALVAFLDGDSGDVRSTINGEQAGDLGSGSVTFARPHRGPQPRRANPTPFSVEIVPRGESPSKVVGIGFEEVSHVLDIECSVRRKDLAHGKGQINVVEDMARALIRRYRGVSNLNIPVYGDPPFFTILDFTLLDVTLPTRTTFVIVANGHTFSFEVAGNFSIGADNAETAEGLKVAINASSQIEVAPPYSADFVLASRIGSVVVVAPKAGTTSIALSITDCLPKAASVIAATFVRSDATRIALDTDPEASDRIRAVVRTTFTFLEAQAAN